MEKSEVRSALLENNVSVALALDRSASASHHSVNQVQTQLQATPEVMSSGVSNESLKQINSSAPDTDAVKETVFYSVCKRLIDIVVALFALIFLLPVLLLLTLLIKLSSPGPVLFRQQRWGKNGRLFWCYKFRTMVVNAEEQLRKDPKLYSQFQQSFKLDRDPRITSIGAILRRTSLDELPQFYNILRGDMTLIGPRPIVSPELEKYGRYGQKLLCVKPGLSGMWQVNGRSDTTYPERVALDMKYIDNRSTWLDLRLMIETIIVVLKGRGAC